MGSLPPSKPPAGPAPPRRPVCAPMAMAFSISLPMIIDGGTHLLSDIQAGPNFGTGFRDTNVWLAQLTNQAFPASFYAGDALGSFNSWMRLLSGILFGVASIWLAFPFVEAAFQQTREAQEEKLKRSALQPLPGAARE